NLPAWDLHARWMERDYEGALALLAEHREVFALPRHRWLVEDRRVRGLVRLKRTAEAVRGAEALAKKRNANRLLPVPAPAAAGDGKQTAADLEAARPQSWFLRSCYQDEDLGPLLRSEPFREVREKFPEPKDRPAPDGPDADGP